MCFSVSPHVRFLPSARLRLVVRRRGGLANTVHAGLLAVGRLLRGVIGLGVARVRLLAVGGLGVPVDDYVKVKNGVECGRTFWG